jgi:GNAT superfamily N-acetyltransferase
MPGIEIRRVTTGDESALGTFLNEAYHPWGRFKYPDRWRWQFDQNPFRGDRDPSVWIAIDRHRIVGQVANTPVPLKVGSSLVNGVNQCDLVVLPQYRVTGIGGALMAAALADVEIALDLWVAPITKRILGHLGYTELPTIPWLQYQAPPSSPERRPTDQSHLEVLRVDRFGAQADALWERVEPDFGIAVKRSAAYLNWKFSSQPHMGYELFEVREGGTLRGIVVVRQSRPPEPSVVILGDLIVPRHDTAVLTALCEFVRTRYARPGRTIVAATSVTEYRRALKACGFVEIQRRRPVSPFIWCRRPPADLQLLAGTMLVGRTDSDWDQYPYAGLA